VFPDLSGVFGNQTEIRARKAILRQQGNRVEQSGTQRIVEIVRRKLFLSSLSQAIEESPAVFDLRLNCPGTGMLHKCVCILPRH